MTYLKNALNKKTTPQSQPIPGSAQVANSAGGYSFAVDDWTRLSRFLVLGAEGGTYYIGERTLTRENAEAVTRCIAADGPRVVREIVAVSEAGRAPKNDPALFALALCAAVGDDATRRAALAALPQVARIGTHLFHFAEYVDGMRGWGRGLRQAVGRWYNAQDAGKLAYQAVKYGQRDGWSHRDLLRLAHPTPATEQHTGLYHWITQGWPGVGDAPHPDAALRLVWASERAKGGDGGARGGVADPRVQPAARGRADAVAERPGGLGGAAGTDADDGPDPQPGDADPHRPADPAVGGDAARSWPRLTDEERLRKARVHPIAVLAALKTYAQGHGERGHHTWTPVAKVVDALDAAFYASFGNVEPTRQALAAGAGRVRLDGLGAHRRHAGPDPAHRVRRDGDDHGGHRGRASDRRLGASRRHSGGGLRPPGRSRRASAWTMCWRATAGIPMGGTDCALPMVYALKHKIQADVFVVYTDSETWAGSIHPAQALREYRQRMGIPAKLVVVGMTSNGFSIADPDDAGMLDVVGFDTATPQLMSDFARS